MDVDHDVEQVAAALYVSVGLLHRRLRQAQADGELSLPETAALSRLERGGPMTTAALARLEQITPQSMGATLSALESRGFLERMADPEDGRRVLLSPTAAGREMVRSRRAARAEQLAQALALEFTPGELEQLLSAAPLIERLAARL